MAVSNEEQEVAGSPVEERRAPPISNRFLFVDVAAQRAKQLRRGALPRLPELKGDGPRPADLPHKLERVAMEEVSRGIIDYDLPEPRAPRQEGP